MPPKRKKGKVPKSGHHPSQSSVDVPRRIKKDIKGAQNYRCWLCDCKANKKRRLLEICHIYPQALSKRRRVMSTFYPFRYGGLQKFGS